MRLNVKQPILDYEGNPLLVNKTNLDGSPVIGKDGIIVQEPEVLRNYLVTALNNVVNSENEVFTAEKKAKIYSLTTKLYKTKEVNLTIEDLSFLKERVGKIYAPLIYGRICDMLEDREISLPDPDESDKQTSGRRTAITSGNKNTDEAK